MYYAVMAKQRSIVASRIEDLLRMKNMSVADLSRASDLSEGAISNILSGKRGTPRSDTIQKLAIGFETSADFLNGKTNNPEPLNAPPLPDYAAEVIASMRKLDGAQNYELHLIARKFVEEREVIRKMARQELIELLLDAGDSLGSPEQTDQIMEFLQKLDRKFYEGDDSDDPPLLPVQ